MNAYLYERLIVVVGPSGAGKDSLLTWLRASLIAKQTMHWARRTITRPAQPGGEDHESLDKAEFAQIEQAGGFALHWSANGLDYGVRHAELLPLVQGKWVMLNGSRAHLSDHAQLFPGMTVLHITADMDVLRQRLQSRGRESHDAIEARLHRSVELVIPASCRLIEVRNNKTLDHAGVQIVSSLQLLPNWAD